MLCGHKHGLATQLAASWIGARIAHQCACMALHGSCAWMHHHLAAITKHLHVSHWQQCRASTDEAACLACGAHNLLRCCQTANAFFRLLVGKRPARSACCRRRVWSPDMPCHSVRAALFMITICAVQGLLQAAGRVRGRGASLSV